jgi:hypothetical protein
LRRPVDVNRWNVALAALRIAAEAGWLTVLYASAAALASHTRPLIGPLEFFAFVAAGVGIGRVARTRVEIGAVLLIGGALLGGVLGWLADENARLLLADPPRALGLHLAGWIAGIAVIRGSIVSVGNRAASQLEGMIAVVPLALGLIWAYTSFAVRPGLWLPFAVGAMWGTVMYLSSSLVAIGMARLKVLHRDLADDRTKRAWRWLVFAVGFGVIPIAIPLGILSGIPLSDLLTPVTGPVQWVIGLLRFPLIFVVWILTEILSPLAPGVGKMLDQLGKAIARRGVPVDQEATPLGNAIGIILLLVTAGLLVFAIFRVARWMLTRREMKAREDQSVGGGLEREIVLPARVAPKRGAARHRPRRGTPHDVVAAYVAALGEMEGDPTYARQPAETPAQHAARIRRAGAAGAPDLARLAAGYQLARYAARPISALENLRALGRFQRIRRAIRS